MKRNFLIFGLLLLILSAANVSAQFSIDDLLNVRRVGDPQLSPDGKTVAYTIGDVNVEANRTVTHIYVVPVVGGVSKQLTTGDRSNSSPRWSPDGSKLAFTTGGQIWTMNADGSDRRQVTVVATGAANPVWSPDGRWIAFASDVYPECKGDEACNKREEEKAETSKVQAKITTRLLYRHWTEWRDRKRTHVFIVPSNGGNHVDLTPGDFDSPPYAASTGTDYAFSPDTKEIAVLRNPDKVEALSTNSDVFVVPIPGISTRETASAVWADYETRVRNGAVLNPVNQIRSVSNITVKNKGYDVAPAYTSDGKYIVYRSQATAGFEADRWRIMRYNRSTGETVELTAGFDLQAEDFSFSGDGKTIYFTALERGKSPVFSVPLEPDFRLRIATHVKSVLKGGYFTAVSNTPDGKSFVFVSSSYRAPAEIFSWNSEQKAAPVQISNGNKPFSALSATEEIEWNGALGKSNHGFVIKPSGFDSKKKYPLLVIIHGGPQSAFNDSWGYRWNPQVFANAGYVVFMPNPRGSLGYGQKFVDEISGDWGGKVYTDIMNGVAEMIKQPYVDKENIGAAGASYGGYMVNWLLGHNNDKRFRFKAFVSHAGVYNLENMATVTEELWFVNWEFKGMPWQNPVNYQKWSPHRFASNFNTPTLVTQGEIDYRVPVDQSLQLFTTLQLKNVDSKLIVFPDEGHWILKPQNSKLWYNEFTGWFGKHLQNKK